MMRVFSQTHHQRSFVMTSIQQLAQTAAVVGVRISAQGLDQRFTEQAAACLEQVFAAAVVQVIAADPLAVPLLSRFPGWMCRIALRSACRRRWPTCGLAVPKAP